MARPPSPEDQILAKAQQVVQEDLRKWQEKFTQAADEGADEIDERMTEISDRLIQNQANRIGNAHIKQLEETVQSSLTALKADIISIIKKSTDKDIEESEEAISTAVRKAGVAIKEKAQSVRTWRQSYDRETNSLIGAAAIDIYNVVDEIKELGLQEIGMRWAWTDGITHKDWKKYHALKHRFDEWRAELEQIVLQHPGIDKARAASEEVENKAMDIAEGAAEELARIKEVAQSKLLTRDSSDDFSTPQETVESVSPVSPDVLGTSEGDSESDLGTGGEGASSLPGTASSSSNRIIAETPTASEHASSAVQSMASSLSEPGSSASGEGSDGISEVSSSISSSVSSASSEAPKKVWGGAMAQHVEAKQIVYDDIVDNSKDDGSYSEKIQSMASEASDKFSDITRAVSEALLKQPRNTQESVERVTLLAAEQYSSAIAAASSVLYGTSQGPGESVASVASSRYAEAVAA